MARLNIAPTKSSQLALTQELKMATEGFNLMEQKREILVMELMQMLNKVKDLQASLEERQKKAYTSLRLAISQNGYHHLRNIASDIHYEPTLEIATKVTAGIRTPLIKLNEVKFQAQFGFAHTGSLVDQTMKDFLELMKVIALQAEMETTVFLLAHELKKTQRRVNALEHIFIPDYKDTLHFITESLESKDLDSFFVMKMIKRQLNEESQKDLPEQVSNNDDITNEKIAAQE